MTIAFTPKTNITEIEVEGYGLIRIRPYGAGEELQIAKNFRELNEAQKEAEGFLADIKAKYGDDESQLTESEKKHFEKIQQKAMRLSDDLKDIIRGTISSPEKGVAERLFNELPMAEIRRLITASTEKEADA